MKRLFLLLLLLFSVVSYADTIPAVFTGEYYGPNNSTPSGSPSSWMGKGFGGYEINKATVEGAGVNSYAKYCADSVSLGQICWSGGPALSCPDMDYTRSPDGKTCTKPDCPAGQVYSKLGGKCVKPCTGNQTGTADGLDCQCDLTHLNNMAGERPWLDGTGSIPSELCDGGCMRKTGFGLGGGGKYTVQGGAFSGAKCDGVPEKRPEKPPIPNHKPECSASEGVMTSSSGTVACVPEGTPDGRKPVIKKETKNETFPDGSTKNTETTKTKDPATGAEDTQTKTTTGPKPDGSSGQAGPVGTGGSSGSNSGTGGGGGGNCQEGENCNDEECDPTLNFCGGPKAEGIYTKKDKTAEGPLQAFASGVRSSLLGSNASGFFTVTIPSGGCPSWSVEVPYLKTHIDVSQYICSAPLVAAMDVIGAVLVVLAAFAAFRWAML